VVSKKAREQHQCLLW